MRWLILEDEADGEVLDPAQHLAIVRTGLKRLCYSVKGLPIQGLTGEDRRPVFDLPVDFTTGLSFAEFPVLEQLEV